MPGIHPVTSPEGVASATYSATLLSVLYWLVLLICPLILGAVAISKIRRSGGRLYGLRLALVEVLVGPLFLLAGVIYAGAMLACRLFGFPEERWVPGLTFVIWCVVAWFLGRHVWRSIQRPVLSKGLAKKGDE